jgi:hypothetical protein
MSAIAHHTDIDSPPLANLPALSRFNYQSLCQIIFFIDFQSLEIGVIPKKEMGRIPFRASSVQGRSDVRRNAPFRWNNRRRVDAAINLTRFVPAAILHRPALLGLSSRCYQQRMHGTRKKLKLK